MTPLPFGPDKPGPPQGPVEIVESSDREIPSLPTYSDTNVENGRKYCDRIRAVTEEGNSEMMETDDIILCTAMRYV